MWHDLFRSLSALPRPRAHILFIVGPTSMSSSFTYSICSSRFLFCASAFAAADWMSFSSSRAPLCGRASSSATAST